MAKCAYCGTRIFFGGVRKGGVQFCNDECAAAGFMLDVADQVPADLVTVRVQEVVEGPCPKCAGPGPVDVHTSYRVWSALYVTRWSSRPHVACSGCGARARLKDLAFSFFLGWWGFPWGFIMTPIQLFRNAAGLIRGGGDGEAPSSELEQIVRIQLAAGAIDAAKAREAAAPHA